jgi:hypothetical protein
VTTRYLNLRAGDTASDHVHASNADVLTACGVRIDTAFQTFDEEDVLIASADQAAAIAALQSVHTLLCQGIDLPGAPARGVHAYVNVDLDGVATVDTSDAGSFVCVRLRGGLDPYRARLAIAAAKAYVAGATWPTPATSRQLDVDARYA